MASDWDKVVSIHDVLAPQWRSVTTGMSLTLVVDCEVHTTQCMIGNSVPDGQKLRVFGDIQGPVSGCRRMTLLDVLVDRVGDCMDLLLTDASVVVAHGLSAATDALRFVEVCSGIACSGTGLTEVGFQHLASVEWKEPLVALHRSCHPGVPVLLQDITSDQCAKQLLQDFRPPFSLMSGFSCQPYSAGGSQRGASDERSSTLPATLRLGHLCQCPVILLECVAPARCQQFVQAHLKLLESALGYHVSQQCLKLEDVWTSRRFRWWVVATHPSIGLVRLQEWPKSPHLNVRDLMPVMKQWDSDVLAELELSPHEIEKFTLDGSHLRKYLIQKDGKLPTCLHSWGSQADACPCG